MSELKYNNKHCFLSHKTYQIFTANALNLIHPEEIDKLGNLEKFDSILEARTFLRLELFRQLVKKVLPEFLVEITRQYHVIIKPKTIKYPQVTSRIDFALTIQGVDSQKRKATILRRLFETKGFETKDFKLKMKFLEYTDPISFNQLIKIIAKQQKNSPITQVSINKFGDYLIDLLNYYLSSENFEQLPPDEIERLKKFLNYRINYYDHI